MPRWRVKSWDGRRLAVHCGWYTGMLAGVLPTSVLGFISSAMANRLVFVAWALALVAVYVVVLRRGAVAGWSPELRIGFCLLVLSAGLGVFGGLIRIHREILDLGYRAMLPQLYHPWLTRPAASFGLAGLLGVLGVAYVAAWRIRKPDP